MGVSAASAAGVPDLIAWSERIPRGGQVGYNWQMGWVVLGVEGEISGAGIKGTTPSLVILACKTETDWVATLAGRLW